MRAHGKSDKRVADLSPRAHISDVGVVLERLAGQPAFVIGHSFGGHVALGVAADRPDLVRGLVVAEASAAAAYSEETCAWFESWPDSFADRAQAESFFSAASVNARAWTDQLEHMDDVLRPSFSIEDMIATSEAARQDLWGTLEKIDAPTLLVMAADGLIPEGEVERMMGAIPKARHIVLPQCRHDLHLDDPEAFVAAVETFLNAA